MERVETRFFIRWRAVSVFLGYMGYKAYYSWQRFAEMDAFGKADSEIIKELQDQEFTSRILGKKSNKQASRFESDIINLIESLRGKDFDQAYSNGINLLSYYDEKKNYDKGDPMRLCILLPHLYVLRAKREDVFRLGENTEKAEAAAHYAHYTRELCLSYLLRSGSIMAWLSQAAKDDLFSVALSLGIPLLIFPKKTVSSSVAAAKN